MVQEILRLEELDVIVLAYCIMSNHVHIVLQLPDSIHFSPAKMMQRLKGRTALEANKLLHRQGEPFGDTKATTTWFATARKASALLLTC